MVTPILKPNSSWFTPTLNTVKRSIITTINILDSYTPSATPTDSWDASVAQDGGIMCYVEGTVLTIAGNGSGKIMANADSSYTFSHATDFYKALTSIDGLHLLDTSSCTNMSYMFFKAYKLTSLDLSGFNTSNVTDMTYMLGSDSASYPMGLTSIIFGKNFNTSKVQSFGRMFQRCNKITEIDVTGFDTSSATAMNHMFNGCNALTTLDVSKFDTSKNTSCRCMFQNCNVLTKLDVSNWDTSKVTDMYYMFTKCYALSDCDPSGFDTSSCTTMRSMFSECQSIPNFSVAGWDVSKVTDMGFMFYDCENLTALDFANWDVSNVTIFDHFLAHSINLANFDVSKWKVNSACTHFGCMFHSTAVNYLNVSGFDTSGAISMFSMFEAMRNLEKIDGLQNFDTSNCHAFEQMFSGCYALKELDLSSWDTRKADIDTKARSDSNNYTSQCTKSMFAGCHSLEKITLGANFTFAGDGTAAATYHGSLPTPSSTYIPNATGSWYGSDGVVYAVANIPNLTANTYYATKLPMIKPNSSWFAPTVSTVKRASITEINIVNSYTPTETVTDSWDASLYQDSSIMCYVEGTKLTIAGSAIVAHEDSGYVFCDINNTDYFKALTIINGANLLDTSNATTMTRMFNQCNALTYVDVSNWNTSKVTNMRVMFQQCNKLATLDVSNWDTGNVTDIGVLFSKCYVLNNIDVSNWNLSKVTDMKNMFRQCSALTSLNTTNWNVSSCKTMYGLFDSCTALVDLDVSNWDVSSVEDFTFAFYDCPITALDVSNWDVSSGKIFNGMFEMCEGLTSIDVSKWNMSSATDLQFMFYKCTGLTEIDFANWDVSNVQNFDHFLAHSTNLAKYDVSKWNVTSACTNMYAMFHSTNITSIDLTGWDTSNVIAFGQMFEGTSLTEIKGLETWNTSNGIDFAQMFNGCSGIKELNLSSFDTRKAMYGTTISTNKSKSACTQNMLAGCSGLEKITLGVNFTFAGDGTADATYYGTLPTPASGYWYLIDSVAHTYTAYTADEIKALDNPAGVYCSTRELAEEITKETAGKKYISLNSMRVYHDMIKKDIDSKVSGIAEIAEDISEVRVLVGDISVSDQIAAANIIYVGPDMPTDPNIKVWINTAEENPGSGSEPSVVAVLPRMTSITLTASNWTGSSAPYSQVVEIATVTSATKVDLQPTASQLVSLQNEEIGLMAENDNGVITVYAFGAKPSTNMIMQAILQEVSYV